MEDKTKGTALDVGSLVALVEKLTKRLDNTEKALEDAKSFKVAKDIRSRLKGMRAGESRGFGISKDSNNPKGIVKFVEDDTVRLKEDCPRGEQFRKALMLDGQLKAEEPLPVGIVLKYMYTNRKGERKYKV